MRRLVAPIVLLALLALMPGRTGADVAPDGPEFQVNTYTTGDQREPKVAADGSGRFVVVWQSGSYYGSGPDGSGYGVAARRFDAAGTPAGAEFAVNTYTAGPQESPDVAAAPGGDFLVAWQGGDFRSEQDGSASGVFVQRFAGSGARLGQEFRANTEVRGFQQAPVVAVGPTGDAMVVWQSAFFGFPPGGDGDGFGVFAQRYGAGGVPLGGEFQVNTFTPGFQANPAVAADPAGGFVVTWESQTFTQDATGSGIFARRFDASGIPSGGEFRVNSFTTEGPSSPAVATDPDGGFVVVWQNNSIPGPGDRDRDGVFGQRFDGNDAPAGAEFQVNTYTTGAQENPRVAIDGDGNFVVVWESASYGAGQDGNRSGVFGQHFLSTGDPIGREFQVNTYTTGDQDEPAIAAGPDGAFVVTWTSGYPGLQDGDGSGIFAQRFRTSAFEPPHAATGRRLALRDDTADPRKQRLTLRADDTTIGIGSGAGSRDDPTRLGGSVHVTCAQFDQTYALPASGWRSLGSPGTGKGYRYRATGSSSGPVSEVVLRPGGIRITGKGAALGLVLATNPVPVTVVLQLGSAGVRHCMSFGGTTSYQPGRRYRAQDAPVVATCGR